MANRFGDNPFSQPPSNRFGGEPLGDRGNPLNEKEKSFLEKSFLFNPDRSAIDMVVDNIVGVDDGVTSLGEFITKPIGEAGEGFVSGVIGILEGIGGLASIVPDMVTGSDIGGAIDRGGDKLRESLDINPEGLAGKGTEFVTQYLAPGLGAVNIASKVGKAAKAVPKTKMGKLGQYVKDGAIFAGVETVVADDQASTVIGDWIGFNPMKTTDLIGLSGREAAAQRLLNKAKIFTEANVIGNVVGGLLYSGGVGARAAGRTTTGQRISKKASDYLAQTANNIDNLIYKRMTAPDDLSTFQNRLAGALAFGRYRGVLPEQVADQRLFLDPKIQVDMRMAEQNLADIDKEIKKAMENLPPQQGSLTDAYFINRIDDYLVEKDAGLKARILSELPKSMRQPVLRMRKHVDVLSNKVLQSDFLQKAGYTTPEGLNVEDIIRKGMGSYLRRNYEIYTNSKYKPTEESIKAADIFFRGNKKMTESELTTLAKKDKFRKILTDDFIRKNNITVNNIGTNSATAKINGEVTQELAEKARQTFLDRHTIYNQEGKLRFGLPGVTRVARDKLDTGIFVTRTELPKTLRALMGEVKDPREAYLSTVADLSQFSAVDDYFATIARLSDESPTIRQLFIPPSMTRAGVDDEFILDLKKKGYVRLGSEEGQSIAKKPGQEDQVFKQLNQQGWGQLDGYYVPKDVYNDLTRFVARDDTFGAAGIRYLANAFLRGKALSQYSKTVLSPITQVRNFTTAIAFATANGNIPAFGRGGSLGDAKAAISASILKRGDEAVLRDLEDARRRGILGTNTELREIQDSLRKGILSSERDMSNRDGMSAILGEDIARKVKSAPGAKAVMKGTRLAEEFYQGSDDFWKYYSYHAEQVKLKYALEGVSDAQKLSYLVKGGKGLDPDTLNTLRRAGVSTDDLSKINLNEYPGLYDTLIKDRAAQIVRDTVPNYNKAASSLVSSLRRLPFGNFIVFPMEIYRTSFNIARQAIDDMASDIAGIQARGRQRLTGLLGTTVAVPIAFKHFMHDISGVSREEMEAYQQVAGAPWEKGATLIPLGKEDGKIQYINFSISNPYDTLVRPLVRLIREVDNAEKTGASTEQIFNNAVLGSLYEIAEPFVSEAMLTESIVDAVIQNQTATGARIYDPKDPAGDKIAKGFAHILNTVIPNFVPFTLERINPLQAELNPLDPLNFNPLGVKVKPKKILRQTIGAIAPDIVDPEDKLGRQYGPEQLIYSLMAVTPQEFDPEVSFRFSVYELSSAQKRLKSAFSSVLDDANVNSQQILDGYITANRNKFELDKKYYQVIEGYRKLGLDDKKIGEILQKEKIGGVKSILAGKFQPYKVSRTDFMKLSRFNNVNLYPRQSIERIQKMMINRSLVPGGESRFGGVPIEPSVNQQLKEEQKGPTPLELFNKGIDKLFSPPAPPPGRFGGVPLSSNTIDPNIRTNPIIVGDNPNTQTIAKITG